jgi:Domain of unknown function (DUF4336)
MNKFGEWRVGEHGPLQKLEANLWRVEGEVGGTKLRRVMTLAKLADGGLLVHNAIAMTEWQMQEVEAWGPVRYIVVPNAYHRLDCARFKRRYPKAAIVTPKGAVKRVREMTPVDLTFDEFPSDENVELRHLAGTRDAEGVLTVHHEVGSSVVLNDLVFNMPHVGGGVGWFLRYVTRSTGGPVISRVARLLVVHDKSAIVRELDALADIPGLKRVIVSHHEVIDEKPAEVLKSLARSL